MKRCQKYFSDIKGKLKRAEGLIDRIYLNIIKLNNKYGAKNMIGHAYDWSHDELEQALCRYEDFRYKLEGIAGWCEEFMNKVDEYKK